MLDDKYMKDNAEQTDVLQPSEVSQTSGTTANAEVDVEDTISRPERETDTESLQKSSSDTGNVNNADSLRGTYTQGNSGGQDQTAYTNHTSHMNPTGNPGGSYSGNPGGAPGGVYPNNTGYSNHNANINGNVDPNTNVYPGTNAYPGTNSYPGNTAYPGSSWQSTAAGQTGGGRTNQNMHNPYQNTASGAHGNYSGYGNYESHQGNYQYGSADKNGSTQNDYGKVPAGGSPEPEKQPKQHKPLPVLLKRFMMAAVLAVFFGVIAGVSFFAVNSAGELMNEQEAASVAAVPDTQLDNQIKSGVTEGTGSMVVTDVTDVVENTMPSLVSITNSFTSVTSFWGQNIEQEEEAAGSGIIIGRNDKELLIVTNNHVVADATKLQVQFIDTEMVEGHIKGTNPSMDLAVIAVKLDEIKESTAGEIVIATIGDSDTLRIGEPVIAIGNALGYGQSVTTGVVSALNRTLEVSERGTSNALIQTDAAINPGNSGGALLDINGQVIGINSNKIGGSVVEGMGYAIPISSAKPIINELMNQETKEKVAAEKRGYLGISCINVTGDMSAAYGMPEGIYVAQVYNQTGAAAAGLIKGDIIVAFAGNTVKTQADLTNQLQYYAVDDQIQITVKRGNPAEGYTDQTITVTLCSQDAMNVEQTP